MTSTKETTSSTRKLSAEVITPHKLTIAILIRNFCQFRDLEEFKALENNALSCKFRRDFSVLTLKLLQSPDLTLNELLELLTSTKYNIPQTLIDSFEKTLSDIYENGTGNMLDAIDSLNRVMAFNENTPVEQNKCFITKNSIIGYYLRRLIVNFDKLSFSEVTGVYLSFQRYYAEWQKDNQFKVQLSGNVNKILSSDDWGAGREQWSRRQAELFIATQAALLTNNEEKALSPPELQKRIACLLKSNPELSEAHFLSYLNYMRVKEFCGALDSLYHCFDRSIVVDNKGATDEKSKGYRYAALNLAILHYHFGHQEEALASLKEAIKVSQEANDNVCLQHALSWLYQLTITNKDKLIVHSVLKSFQLNLNYTTSLGLQTFVQYGCSISGNPYQIFETLTKSDIINCQHNYRDLISNSYSVKSCLWQFYGKTDMSSLWSQLLLYLNIDCKTSNKAFYGEGFCLSLCNMANHLLIQGEYKLVSTVLNFVKQKYPSEPHSLIWKLSENLYTFVRCLYHENWIEAEAAARKIIVIDKWEGYLRLAELYFYMQDYAEASNCITVLLNHYENEEKEKPKSHYYIRAKILLAEVQFASCYPNNVPSGILSLLYNSLIKMNKNQLNYQTALIHLNIANVQLLLGLTGQALNVLDRCLVQILAHGGCYDRARATLLFVKCLIADSNTLEENKRKEVILNAANLLSKAKNDFKKVEAFTRAKDVLYLQANLYDYLDKKDERNKCSLEFRLLDEECASKNSDMLFKYL